MDESLHTGDEYLGKTILPDAESFSEEILPISRTANSEPDKETEKMEVHKHPHPHHVTHKKKWNAVFELNRQKALSLLELIKWEYHL